MVFILLTCVLVPFAFSASVKEFFSKGYIDWTQGAIYVTGKGRGLSGKNPVAEHLRVAREDAIVDVLVKAEEIISGLRVDSQSVGSDEMLVSDILSQEIDRLIKAAPIRRFQTNPDGTVIIESMIPLYGPAGIGSVLMAARLGAAVVNEAPLQWPSFNAQEAFPGAPDGLLYTGLVVDARLVGVKPSLLPKIYAHDGRLIYGEGGIPAIDFANAQGAVTFVSKPEDVKQYSDRIGKSPLIINAVAAIGTFKTDVLIFNSDAKKITNANAALPFLKNAGVVFIVK